MNNTYIHFFLKQQAICVYDEVADMLQVLHQNFW